MIPSGKLPASPSLACPHFVSPTLRTCNPLPFSNAGVGKTELAKALAAYLFNAEDAITRIGAPCLPFDKLTSACLRNVCGVRFLPGQQGFGCLIAQGTRTCNTSKPEGLPNPLDPFDPAPQT